MHQPREAMHNRIASSLFVVLVCAFGSGCEIGEDGDEDGGTPPENCSTNEAVLVEEGESMEPGGNCITCHAQDEGPSYTIAGTVMGATDDDDRCAGVASVTVEITDANGSVISLATNNVGNFFHRGSVATPYTAKVVRGGDEIAMAAPQSDLNCANCHTAEGLNSAPGRILAP